MYDDNGRYFMTGEKYFETGMAKEYQTPTTQENTIYIHSCSRNIYQKHSLK